MGWTPASSQDQQQQRTRMRSVVKVRLSQEEAAFMRSASQLSQGSTQGNASGLRDQQQQKQQKQQKKKRADEKKRKKRSSFGSTGSGTSSSSAFGGSSEDSKSNQKQQQERFRLYGEPDVVIHAGGCSFGVHLHVLKNQCPLLYKRIAFLRGQFVAYDMEHDGSGYHLSSGGANAEAREALSSPSFSFRAVDGTRFLDNSLGSENALSSSPVLCPLERESESFLSRRLGSEKRRKTETTRESVFSSVHCIAHTKSRSAKASDTASASTNTSISDKSESRTNTSISDKSEPRSSPPVRVKKAKPTVPVGSPMVLRSRTKQQRGRGTFTTSMVAGPSDFANAGTQDSPTIAPVEGDVEKENRDHNSRQSPEAARDLDHQEFLLGLQQQQEAERQAALKEEAFEAQRKKEQLQEEAKSEHQQAADNQQLAVVPESGPKTEPLHVEWCLVDPAAVASVLEFMYTQNVQLANEESAEPVIQLCRWLCLQNELLCACLSIVIENMTSEKWMNVLLVCAKMENREWKEAMIEQLLAYIHEVPPERYPEILENVRMEYLAVITDPVVLSRVVMCFVNHIRHVGVWRNILFGLEQWTCRVFNRRRTISLLEFHRQYAHWDPCIALPGVEIGGEEYYVRPKTLFRFGPFAFQVRFEMDSLVLIQWRVIKEDSSQPDSPLVEVSLHRSDPVFTLRGEMLVRFKCSRKGPTQEQSVTVRYNHCGSEYGVWKSLIVSSSSAKLLSRTEARGGRRSSEEPPSQNESVTTSQSQPEPREEEEKEEAVEFMRARFLGRFFVWGHQLCNAHHYLSVCTLFYSSPTGSVGDILNLNVIDKMRKLPVDSLVMILRSDRLRVPSGETMLVQILTYLCFNIDYSNAMTLSESGGTGGSSFVTTDFSAINIVRDLFSCVRWCYVDLSQIMTTLERSARKYQLYEVIESGLKDPLLKFPRRVPYGKSRNPYQVVTSLVEFEIEAGDRSLSPSCYPPDLSSLSVSD